MILETRYSVLCFNLHGIFYPLFILKSKAFHKVHLGRLSVTQDVSNV